MKWRKFLAILLALSILCSLPITTALAADGDAEVAEYELYPIPQNITYGTGNSNLPTAVNAYFGTGIDKYTVDRAVQTLSHGGLTMNQVDAAENAQLIVEIYSTAGNSTMFGQVDPTLFTKIDAYLLVIAGNKVGVLGKDTDAAFYGLTTLQQILDQTTGGVVRNLTIQDWADVASRGFIEGYYGNPWSTEDRAELMRWAGNFKLNSYFYAPKDDPKHNSNWDELYTDEELETKIKPLAEAGNASKCQFVYALHPFMNAKKAITQSNYNDKLKLLKAKFEQVIGAGVRQIAVLADDAGNQGNDLYIQLMADLVNWVSSEQMQEMNPYTEGGVDARYVYLVNEGEDAVTFTLSELALTIDELSGVKLVGVNGLTVNEQYGKDDAERAGTYTNWFDGNVSTAAGFSRYQKTDGTITFDLGQSREITSVEALVQDSQKNYIRKGVIEVADSLDGQWTTIVTIDKYETWNTYDEFTAGSVGWGSTNSNYPNYRSYLGTLDEPVTARYLRIRITADYSYRFINLNEIIINGGEYVPSSSNPTFVADPNEVSAEYLPEFVADGNITTGFKPNMEGRTSGSLIYKLSDQVEIDQINILQSSGAISNAEVFVRGVPSENAVETVSEAARAGKWVKLGTLTDPLTSFYTYNFESIYEIKITWGDVSPLIYEIALIPRGVLAVDKTQLASLVEQREEIVQQDESKYDATALSAYREARKAAQDILAGTVQSQAQVNEAYAKLNSAHRALLQSVNDLSTAKEQLNALKNSYNETEYTPNSWTTFTTSEAYQNVANVLADNNLTAIKAATQALLDAAENTLQRCGDLTKLNELLASIEKLTASDYTTASYEALQKVVEEAKALVADAENATDTAIDAMVQKLRAAVENLERKSAPARPSTTSKYTLRFVTNGGAALDPITAIKGTTIKLKDYVPTREGYTFAGWYADAALTERITEVTLNASTSIYAKWTKNGMPFTDVKVGTWYYDAVAFVYENGLMQGTSATRFSPDSSLTRAMLAQILYNRAGKPTVKGQSAFTDVANDAWYADAVIWAYGEGIVSGMGGGKFAPDAPITREQLSAMLYRAAGSPEGKETILPFTDASKVSSYAKRAICWAVEEGIVTGKGAGRLDPTGTATRAEVAQMLARFENS